MKNKKNFFRGLGLGLVVASLLLSFYRPDGIEDEDIIKRAKELGLKTHIEFLEQNTLSQTNSAIIEKARTLGMVFPNEIASQGILEEDVSATDDPIENNREPIETEESVERIIIEYGMSSEKVSRLLYEEGIIDSMENFNNYLIQNNLTKRIIVGNYYIDKNSTFEEIANIITNKR